MPRGPRARSEAGIYHVIERGTGRQLLFEDGSDREKMFSLLSALPQRGVEVLCWCFMGNHVHLLLKGDIVDLGTAVKNMCSTYATYFNMRHGRVGHLFQGRYKSEAIDSDAYLMTVVRYIHQNPLHAGISESCDYAWSSYGEYMGKPRVTNTDFVLDVFGGKREFENFHAFDGAADTCMESELSRSRTRAMSDETALMIARKTLGGVEVGDVKSLPKASRDAALCNLKKAGLSVRQIERLCGIGRNVVQRANESRGRCI